MKVNFLVSLILIISTLQNYLTVTVYAYKEPLAKLWKVTYRELPKLLGYEKNLTLVDGLLEEFLKQYNKSIGGTFIDVPTNKIHINVLKNKMNVVKHALKSYLPQYEHLFFYNPVQNSIAALKITFEQILNIANRTRPLEVSCYISIQSNHVFIKSRQDNYTREFLDAIRQIKQFNKIVDLLIVSGRHNTQPPFVETNNMKIDNINTRIINPLIMAGDGISSIKGTCSLGFWAKSKNLKSNYAVTAGHCGTGYQLYYHPWYKDKTETLIGTVEKASVTPLDVGLITAYNDEITKFFNETVVIRNSDSKYNKELIVEDDVAVSSYGAHICKSGYTKHVACGKIIGFDGFFIDGKGNIIYPITYSTAANDNGDSGGPTFSYKQDLRHVSLNGIHVMGGIVKREYESAYIPLEEILRKFELKLMLSGSSSNSSNPTTISKYMK